MVALPGRHRIQLFRDLHAGIRHLLLAAAADDDDSASSSSSNLETAEKERAAVEAILVLSQLYSLAGDEAPTASDWRRIDDDDNNGMHSPVAEGAQNQDRTDSHPALLDGLLDFYEKKTAAPSKGGENRDSCHPYDADDALFRPAVMTIVTRLMWTDCQPPASSLSFKEDKEAEDDDEPLLFSVLHALQSHPMAWRDFVTHQNLRNENWRQSLLQRYYHHRRRDSDDDDEEGAMVDEDQRSYLESLLLHVDDYDSLDRRRASRPASSPTITRTQLLGLRQQRPQLHSSSELDRRIQQVRRVLPHLGEGFVETALSYYRGDVEQTIGALVQDDDDGLLPESLRRLDRSLPRRRKGRNAVTKASHDGDSDNDPEALEVTRSLIRAADIQQEVDAAAVDQVLFQDEVSSSAVSLSTARNNEYDDDYDDQYDEMEPAADLGTDDYDTILAYNRVVKSLEQERKFWEGEKNANRVAAGNPSSSQTPYRGPDKLKGGRIPRAGGRDRRGGGRGGRGGGGTVNDQSPSVGGARENVPEGHRTASGSRGDAQIYRDGGGSRGNGRGPRGGSGSDPQPSPVQTDLPPADPSPTLGNHPRSSRAKTSMLAKRREKQKQAAAKRIG
jgi:hypothetical protein